MIPTHTPRKNKKKSPFPPVASPPPAPRAAARREIVKKNPVGIKEKNASIYGLNFNFFLLGRYDGSICGIGLADWPYRVSNTQYTANFPYRYRYRPIRSV